VKCECIGCARLVECDPLPKDWDQISMEIDTVPLMHDVRQTSRVCILHFCPICSDIRDRVLKCLGLKNTPGPGTRP
jgi:hypothetical protein